MGRFSYMARDLQGAAVSGEIAAVNQAEAAKLLRAEGKIVVRLRDIGKSAEQAVAAIATGPKRIKQSQVVQFATQLGVMIDTGVPLAEALAATIDQAPPSAFRRVVEDVNDRVQSGQEFSATLAAHPNAFSPFFVNLVRASEASGTMGSMLRRAATYLSNQANIRKKIRSASMYPAVMLILSIAVTIFLMTFVMPRFTSIYAGKHAVLPLPTRALIGLTDWLTHYGIYLGIVVVGTVVGLTMYLRSASGRSRAHWLKLHLPMLGRMFHKACLARSLRTMGTLIGSGVSMLESVQITRDVVGNHYYEKLWEETSNQLKSGRQLSEPLYESALMDRSVARMIASGERTGQLGPVMDQIADFSEQELSDSIANATKLIEPALMIVMGTVVGFIAIAMLLPIFTISKIMGH